MIKKMLLWINKNYSELMNSDMEKYHLKTFIQKGCKGPDFLMENAKEYSRFMKSVKDYAQAHPEFSTSRRYSLFNIFTGTIQIFRGGRPCPNIELQNDKLGAEGLSMDAGFWDIGEKGGGDVVIPLKKDDTSTESSTELLIKALPYPDTISLKDLLNVDAFKNGGHLRKNGGRLRLYLFCCRVEEKGQEASNSQASDASQSKKGYINEYGGLTHAQSKRLRSKGKRSLSSSFSRLVSKSRR
jgi:hypothetical protein